MDRPLKEIGVLDAHRVAGHFAKLKIEVQAVYSSPAIRALHTCVIFLRSLSIPFNHFSLTHELYDFSGEQVMQFLKSLPDSVVTVMVFGHNHAFTALANTLGNSYIENVPTSGLVHLKFDTNKWTTLSKGTTENILFPKELRS
jgi:phosphohistidine phosphatase